jgi:hypothetical protein
VFIITGTRILFQLFEPLHLPITPKIIERSGEPVNDDRMVKIPAKNST